MTMANTAMAMQLKPINIDAVKNIAAEVTCSMFKLYFVLKGPLSSGMNVVILTPDRVGSTLLQRLITIYMQFHEFDQPVINLHELTNGLMRYYSPVFNREVLGKDTNDRWGYHQTLPEIRDLLSSVDHYKTSRLAQYHIKNRQDSVADQLPFYQYINDNFFVISAQRENLLEHALSWCIFVVSRNLNVYTAQDKFHHFAQVYKDRITVDRTNLWRYLDAYVEYLEWVNRHFHVNSYFVYDQHRQNLEKYILDLPIFNAQSKKLTWQDTFDIEFSDWNRCHYLCSDMSGISTQIDPQQLQIGYNNAQGLENIELAPVTQLTVSDVIQSLGATDQRFLHANGVRYKRSSQHLQELVDNKILVTGVPIKLQTMMEKRLLVRNFAETVEWYNQWVERTGVGQPYTEAALLESAAREIRDYHAVGLELSQQKDDAPHESPRLTNDSLPG